MRNNSIIIINKDKVSQQNKLSNRFECFIILQTNCTYNY